MTETALRAIIESAFEGRSKLTPENTSPQLRHAVNTAIGMLDRGELRLADRQGGRWQVHAWLKMAILLYFRMQPNQVIDAGGVRYYDKIPLKYATHSPAEFAREGVRVVPSAIVRYGAYVAPDVVLMPCYVNIGAWVGCGSMIDTWATIGSGAQIGQRVHISGGAGIGGVLEPLQAMPTIIEDDCFIGARSEIVEGVVVGQGAVISMGVFIGQSTRIYDRETGETLCGQVPAGAVVVPGSLASANGRYSLHCAVIVKRVDAKTRAKVGINALLRQAHGEL